MRYPRLLKSAWRIQQDGTSIYDISRNGIGVLSDTIECIVTEEKNGAFTLSMSYPVGGSHWLDIDVGLVIVCKPNEYAQEQPFVIKKISKAMGGAMKITAEHLSYNLSGIMVSGFNARTTTSFLNELKLNAIDCPFTFTSDIIARADHLYNGAYHPPRSYRSLLLEGSESFLGLFGGEFAFDGASVSANQRRGSDSGVIIRYGKNLLALTQARSIRDFPTAAYPYWYKENADGNKYVELPEKILQYGAIDYSDVSKSVALNLTDKFEEEPTADDLRAKATDWINANWKTQPPYNLTLSFLELEKTTEYSEISSAESVKLCDTITVIHPEMKIAARMQVVKTVYDVLRGRYKSIEVGDPMNGFADTILKIGGKR